MKTITAVLTLILLVGLSSCEKFDPGEVLEDTYSGNIDVTSSNASTDPAGDFTGNGDSGTYSFAWENPDKIASVKFDITTNSGGVQMILEDKRGKVVLDETLVAGGNDTFSGLSQEGKKGIWTVTLVLTDFNGDGSYSIHPGN